MTIEEKQSKPQFEITRYIETDTAHRIPNHKSKCRHLHGHRYRFTAHVGGDLVSIKEESSEGMVMDFSELSCILTEEIHDQIDHALILWNEDPYVEILTPLKDTRIILVDFPPTAERLAKWAFDIIKPRVEEMGEGIQLMRVVCRETPKSTASYPIGRIL